MKVMNIAHAASAYNERVNAQHKDKRCGRALLTIWQTRKGARMV